MLNVVNDVLGWFKELDPTNVTLFITGWGMTALTLLSFVGKVKKKLDENKNMTQSNVNNIKDETIKEVSYIREDVNTLRLELMNEIKELKEREVETDAKLTKIMKKDPISKYKYGEVKEYSPQVTSYVAEQVELKEEVVEKVEATPLSTSTPLPKKTRKARTSFVN